MNVSELDAVLHEIEINSDVLFTWDYERSRPALVKLYEKAKTSQWNASTDLPWDDGGRLGEAGRGVERPGPSGSRSSARWTARRCEHWGDKEWLAFSMEMQTAVLSQFLHGEQGALVCTGLITATVPWIDAKYYAATQVMDEARHVEVFARYIEEKTERRRTRSTRSSAACSTTSSPTAGGTSPTSACRSWSRAWRWPPSGSCTCSRRSRCSSSCCAT